MLRVGSLTVKVGSFKHKLPTPYKSTNQDKQRIFGKNDSQGREFREFEAINSIPAHFWKNEKKIVYIIENTAENTFYF